MIPKTFGEKPSGERLKKIQQSPNYKNGALNNIEPTEVLLKSASRWKMLKDSFNRPKDIKPLQRMPSVKTDLKNLNADEPLVIWFGHSSYYIQSKDIRILVDPVFSGSASPFKSMIKSFEGSDIYTVDDFPEIDYLVITHDHYDHLNYPTLLKLKNKVKHIVTSLGVGAHLEHWGYHKNMITELYWWEDIKFGNDIHFTATPARHFTGRLLKRNQTLWSSFVLYIHGHKIFLGGDSGYDSQFKEIGKRFGPFDIAILECGQYGENWPYIHMMPEETAQAALDLQAKTLLPVHWGKFALSIHPWNEPIKRVFKEAEKLHQKIVSPKIGEVLYIKNPTHFEKWWDV